MNDLLCQRDRIEELCKCVHPEKIFSALNEGQVNCHYLDELIRRAIRCETVDDIITVATINELCLQDKKELRDYLTKGGKSNINLAEAFMSVLENFIPMERVTKTLVMDFFIVALKHDLVQNADISRIVTLTYAWDVPDEKKFEMCEALLDKAKTPAAINAFVTMRSQISGNFPYSYVQQISNAYLLIAEEQDAKIRDLTEECRDAQEENKKIQRVAIGLDKRMSIVCAYLKSHKRTARGDEAAVRLLQGEDIKEEEVSLLLAN